MSSRWVGSVVVGSVVDRWACVQLACGSWNTAGWPHMARWAALAGLMMMAVGCGSMTGCGASVTVDGQCDTGGAGGEGGDGGAGGDGGTGGATTSSATCPTDCDDGNPCSVDVCDSGTCVHYGAVGADDCATVKQNNGVCAWTSCVLKTCDQPGDTGGELCFREGGVGVCDDGTCVPPCATPADCNDGNPCTLDYCTPSGACSNPEDTLHSACGDGGTCWKGECCEGCFDLAAGACVETCPSGTTCGALGACQ